MGVYLDVSIFGVFKNSVYRGKLANNSTLTFFWWVYD